MATYILMDGNYREALLMARSDPCPPVEVLERFVLGMLPADERQPLDQHVEACPFCVRTLDRLKGEDALIADMRAAPCPPALASNALVEQLAAKLVRLSAELAKPIRLDGKPSAERLGDSQFAFLAPAQQADELGRLGPYRVLQILGEGGMGMVFLAEDLLLKRQVALKVMHLGLAVDKTSCQRFLREAQASAAIDHPRIVPIYQIGEEKGLPFIVMPLLKGETLEDRLQREHRLGLAETVLLGTQIAQGLAVAHQHGLIHRDIKPANIWLEASEEWPGASDAPKPLDPSSLATHAAPRATSVKLLDFGLARAVTGDDSHLTKNGTLLGTPAYMAPEQARHQEVDGRCDLFSLGVVLYRMLTGELPFKGHDTLSHLMALGMDTPQPVVRLNIQVPALLNDLVMQLLAKDPQQRPISAKAVAETLAAIALGLEPGEKEPSPPTPGLARKPASGRLPGQVAVWLGSALGVLCPWKARRRGQALVRAGILLLALILLIAFPFRSGTLFRPSKPEEVYEGSEKTNSLGMKLAYIPAGTFLMGSSPQEIDRCINLSSFPAKFFKAEGPAHEVQITRPFYMGIFEVTVGQFRRFVQETEYLTQGEKAGGAYCQFPDGSWKLDRQASWQNPGFPQTDDHPAVCVSWHDAVAFCNWLSQKEGRIYRLPTEAEWEYCCRAGSQTPYCYGEENRLKEFANMADGAIGKVWPDYPYPAGRVTWDDGSPFTAPVGKYLPNTFGLHEMHGNVWEWCADWYDPDYYQSGPKTDPVGPVTGQFRVLRGGSWNNDAFHCRSAYRHQPGTPSLSSQVVGFRVVLLPLEKP